MDFSRPELLAWRRIAETMIDLADCPEAPSPVQAAYNEHRLLELLLRRQPHTLSPFLKSETAVVAPRSVRRAEEFIREHAAQPITLFDIANAAEAAPRTLQAAFNSARGHSPMRALALERMRRVRLELIIADEQRQVSEIAKKWGFAHLGRFAADYRHTFGEAPSQTRELTRKRTFRMPG